MSETESQTMDSEDDASTTSTHGCESPMTTDSETEAEEKEGRKGSLDAYGRRSDAK